ncbi:coadhesin-like [Stylophora pistillata]|uniref:coadhesin-like n=1 Tax=Stylophora pistillata TaxID=50429 RepID=UPI000C057740|nr:coadhesin-like [Stylophora pistillata]
MSLVVDRAASVGRDNYDMMLDSIKELIKKYNVGTDKTRFSILTYAGRPKIRTSFDDAKYQNKEALDKFIDEMKANDHLGSPTRTDRALEMVADDVFTVPGGYTEWISLGECSVTCGGGRQAWSRTCTNPPPSGKGPTCVEQGLGLATEERECNMQECAVPGGYTEWTEWGECSVTCGGGRQIWSRTCTNPPPSGKGPTCLQQGLGRAMEERECNIPECGNLFTYQTLLLPLAVPGGYTEWTEWGECSVTCGEGRQIWSRTCTNPPPSGKGPTCVEQGLGRAMEEREYNMQECAIPGGYTNWSDWRECSVTCGGGVQTRYRTCTNPPPSGGGLACSEQNLGPAKEGQECNTQECGPFKRNYVHVTVIARKMQYRYLSLSAADPACIQMLGIREITYP